MNKQDRQEHFINLREDFPWFAYEGHKIVRNEEGLLIRYDFNLAGKHHFSPVLHIPWRPFFRQIHDIRDKGALENLAFHIGLAEMVSYWKAACPPEIRIAQFSLDRAQAEWWTNLFYNGLGEFFYTQGINCSPGELLTIHSNGPPLRPFSFRTDEKYLVPVGGGKDSAVSLDILSQHAATIPFMLNPRPAMVNTIEAVGINEKDSIVMTRTLDPELLRLNDAGFLNGHTPFSALLAFQTLLASWLTGARYIALSNESSASEPTIPGTGINHQYSKSLEFESGFRDYYPRYISADPDYFSFLRPLSELQIAGLFSLRPKYIPVFRSCNAGSKTNSWCGKCPKCLFTWIILSPFLDEKILHSIWDQNLLDQPRLESIFDQLSGIAEEKPFDCIGTISEVETAIRMLVAKFQENKLPYLIEHYRNSKTGAASTGNDLPDLSVIHEDRHFVDDRLLSILRKELECLKS